MNQIENTFEISMFSVYYYGFICTTSNREENMSEERKILTLKDRWIAKCFFYVFLSHHLCDIDTIVLQVNGRTRTRILFTIHLIIILYIFTIKNEKKNY